MNETRETRPVCIRSRITQFAVNCYMSLHDAVTKATRSKGPSQGIHAADAPKAPPATPGPMHVQQASASCLVIHHSQPHSMPSL